MKSHSSRQMSHMISLVCLITVTACASTREKHQRDRLDEADLARAIACVRGNMPLEVNFAIENNPHQIVGGEVDKEYLAKLSSQLDARISNVLRESALNSWSNFTARRTPDWSYDFVSSLEDEMAVSIIDRSPRLLNMEYCGGHDDVGNAFLVLISDYFLRASMSGKNDADSPAQNVVMLGVALTLAKIEFEPKYLFKKK